MTNKNKKRLDLINYEGACLRAIKEDNLIIIKDQYNEVGSTLTLTAFTDFINGTSTIADSRGKSWNFLSEHKNTRPTSEMIQNFMNS